jgi:flagellin
MLTGVNGNSLRNNILHADSAKSKSLERISSGKKVNHAKDDPVGNAMLSAFDSQARALSQMMANEQSQSSLLQSASGSLTTTSNILQSINSLSLQASNSTLTDSDRRMIQQQIDELSSQINLGANQAQFNGQNLLDGSFSTTLQNGQQFSIDAMTTSGLGLNNLSVATIGDAMTASQLSKSALGKVASAQSNIGAALNGIDSNLANLGTQYLNAVSAQSQIGDVDMASEIMNLTMSKMQSQASLKIFKMNDDSRSNVLKLLGE